MTAWWGLAGLLGLLGCCGLLRSHRADGAADDDPLARYPVAREPAMPNADTAHTPLMIPAITPEMLARPTPPTPPIFPGTAAPPVAASSRQAAVPQSEIIAREIPEPRPAAVEQGSSDASPAPAAQRVPAPDSRKARAASAQLKPALRQAEPETAPRQDEVPAQQPRTSAPAPAQPEPGTSHEEPPGPQARPSHGSAVRGLIGRAKRLLGRAPR